VFNSTEIDVLLIHLRLKLEEVESAILTLEHRTYARCDAKTREPRAGSRTSLPGIEIRSNHRRRTGAYGRISRFRR
jgi:hypothetical protein